MKPIGFFLEFDNRHVVSFDFKSNEFLDPLKSSYLSIGSFGLVRSMWLDKDLRHIKLEIAKGAGMAERIMRRP